MAIAAFERAIDDETAHVFVSYMSVIEMLYMKEKEKISTDEFRVLWSTLDHPDSAFKTVPIDSGIVQAMERIAREMGDRVIAATAAALDCPLVSKDSKLKPANFQILW